MKTHFTSYEEKLRNRIIMLQELISEVGFSTEPDSALGQNLLKLGVLSHLLSNDVYKLQVNLREGEEG